MRSRPKTRNGDSTERHSGYLSLSDGPRQRRGQRPVTRCAVARRPVWFPSRDRYQPTYQPTLGRLALALAFFPVGQRTAG